MLISSGHLRNFVRYSSNVVRCILVCESSKTKLSFFITTTHKKSTNVINESSMKPTCWYWSNVGLIILVKIYRAGRVLSRHFLTNSSSTLSVLVLSPGKHITDLCSDNSMESTACNLNRFEIQKSIYEHRTEFLLQVRLVDAKLTLWIVSHRVTKLWG